MRYFLALLLFLHTTGVMAAWTERYVDAAAAGGGDGTTTATSGGTGAWTLAEAVTASNTAGGMRINIKAGTYANTTTSRTFADTDGLVTAPIWFRGYNTTPGDIDSNNALTKPAITFTTGQLGITGDFQWFSNLDISGACTTANGQITVTSGGASVRIVRCRVENTAANANSRAITIAGGNTHVLGCWFKATSSAPAVYVSGQFCRVIGCATEGGSNGITIANTGISIKNCVIDSPGADGINSDSSGCEIEGNSIYNATGDAIEVTTTAANVIVANNILDTWGGYAVNSSAGVSAVITLQNNAYRGTGSGTLNQIYESENWGSITESVIPFTNAGSDDFTLISGAGSKGTGFPGAFENESYTGYLDRGAVQRQETGSNTIDPLTGTIPGL